MSKVESIEILHFNDVYHLSDETLVARFASVLENPAMLFGNNYTGASLPPLRIFSGDVFSPSLEAAVLRGEHMTSLLNALNIDLACYGNHDFDFGEERLKDLIKHTHFPWTLTNVAQGDRLLAEAKPWIVRDVGDFKIGFFGLAGTDWPSNCQHLPECEIASPAKTARDTARILRQQEHCDFVIALTHMRLPEDIEVSIATQIGDERVDLLLGGHDHHVLYRSSSDQDPDAQHVAHDMHEAAAVITSYEGDTRIIKSGTDWRSLSCVRLDMVPKTDGAAAVIANIHVSQIHDLRSDSRYNTIPLSPQVVSILADVKEQVANLVTKPLFHTDCPLDGLSSTSRSQETNLGNMLADAVRAFYQCDIALVNSGSIRCDRIIQPATIEEPLCIRDAMDIVPFDNAFVVKSVTGQKLLEALENSVCDDHVDGRFLQISGLQMAFTWSKPEGQRILSAFLVSSSSQPLPLMPDKVYTVAMVDFIATGFDGYTCFKDTPTVVDAEGAMTDTKLLMEIFTEDEDKSISADETAEGVERARNAIIHRYHDDCLPVVSPSVDGRIIIKSSAI